MDEERERGGDREKKRMKERQEDDERAIEPSSKFYEIDIDVKKLSWKFNQKALLAFRV